MASKKYAFIFGLLSLFGSAGFSQSEAGYDWRDSTKIPTRLMPQQTEFLNNQYPFPARPRDQWELGLSGGVSFIYGDVSPQLNVGGGIFGRKSLSHTFSLRLGYIGSINKGLDYRLTIQNQTPVNVNPDPYRAYYGSNGRYAVAYRNRIHQGTFDLVASLLNSSYYRGNPKLDAYLFGGYSIVSMDVDIDGLDGNNQPYNFSSINFNQSRSDIRSDLKDLMDLKYESNAAVLNGNRDAFGRINDNQLLRHAVSGGGGIAWKLSNRYNLGVEQRFTFAFDDNMDAVQRGDNYDVLSYTSLRLNINMGTSGKNVQPLWWINPNNYIYNELNSPQHMKLPTPILPDADGDGVTDQFDMEPNTPAGVAVDTRGVARDTDGDGVPDYKDKELITPSKCFPVDADGVGTCPDPQCCTDIRRYIDSLGGGLGCNMGNLPSIEFRAGSSTLSRDAQALLSSAAAQIKAQPSCRVKVSGHATTSKRAQQLSWSRVNAIIRYFVERQGISEDRFIFDYTTDGDPNTVDMIGTTEQGPNTVPAPHPNLR